MSNPGYPQGTPSAGESVDNQVFGDFLESLPDATILVDQSGIMTSVNSQTEDLFGYSRSELIGQKIELLVPERFSNHAAHRGSYFNKPRTRSLGCSDQLVARKKDGQEFPVDIGLSPFRHADGTLSIVCSLRDFTRHKELEEQLRLAGKVFEESSDGILILDSEGRVVRVNKACTRISDYTAQELRGKSPEFLQMGCQNVQTGKDVRREIEQHGCCTRETWILHKSGEMRPVLQTVTKLKDDEGGTANFIVIISDLSATKEAEEQISQLLQYDPLTELPNHYLFAELGMNALTRAHHLPQGRLAVLYFDLDGTQQVNDSLGYSLGDKLLRLVAQRFKDWIAEGGIVARIVSDEFAILLEGIEDAKAVAVQAEAILTALHQPFDLDGNKVSITASTGIAIYPDNGNSVAELLKHAATAKRKAKQKGNNSLQFYDAEMTAKAVGRLRIENELRVALKKDELAVYYQPQFSLESGQLIGAEALVRWIHPEKGLVSPGEFIPVAEESGLIVPLGEWVLNTACKDLHRWIQQDLPIQSVSVNVAGLQIQRGDLVRRTVAALADNDLAPANLELEITENFIMGHAKESLLQLDALRDMGVGLAIDDFGTDYSSLSYLKRLPIDTLKIDQSFVRDLTENDDDKSIVRAIIALGKSLGFRLIAEGIETIEQQLLLQAKGCDIGQGFLYSRPIPAEAFEKLLRENP